MELIPNYELSGSSNDGNTVTAVREESTTRIRMDASYMRKMATFNAATGIYSVPTIDFVVRQDIPNAEGNPIGQRLTASVGFRLPVGADGGAVDRLITDLRAYVNDPELKRNLEKQLLPTCCASGDEA